MIQEEWLENERKQSWSSTKQIQAFYINKFLSMMLVEIVPINEQENMLNKIMHSKVSKTNKLI